MDLKITADRLKHLRLKLNLKQRDVALITGISQIVISQHETGTSIPGSEKLNQYADCYGTTADYILGRTDDPSPPVRRDEPAGLAYFMERPSDYLMPSELPVTQDERLMLRQIPGHLTPKGYAHILRIIRREVAHETALLEKDDSAQ